MNTQEINALHDQAMDYAGQALLARQRGDHPDAERLFQLAFELERRAATPLINSTLEPSRSIILRSAASLALDCGEIREAERLIAIALSGDPPDTIAAELRKLLMQVIPVLQNAANQ
jgi:hypothetical protein